MPAPTQVLTLSNFSGGLNLRGSERALEPWESPDCYNVEPTKAGGIVKSNGYTRYNSSQIASGANVRGVYNYVQSSTGNTYLLVVCGTGLYSVASNGTVTTISSSLFSGSTSKVYFETFNDVCIICTGDEVPKTYDGSVTGSLTGLATLEANVFAKYAGIYKNKLWLSGNSNKPYRVYYSEAGKHNNWDTANGAGSADINVNDGQIVRQIKAFPEALVVFKDRSVHYVSGDTAPGASAVNPYRVQLATAAVGTKSPGSVVVVGSDMYFLSDGRITSLKAVQQYGNIQAQDVSFNIQPLLQNINRSSISEAFAVHHEAKSQIWFFFPNGSSTQNDTVLIYDYAITKPDNNQGSWWKRGGFTGACGTYINGNPYVGGYDGWLYKHDDGTHYLSSAGASTAIQAYHQTAWLPITKSTQTKRVRSIDVTLGSQVANNLTLNTFWDYRPTNGTYTISQSTIGTTYLYAGGGVLYGSAYYMGSQDKKIDRVIADIGNGKMFSLKVSNNAVDVPFSVLAYDIEYQPRGNRYGGGDNWFV